MNNTIAFIFASASEKNPAKTLSNYDSLYGPRIKPLITNEKTNIDIDNIHDMFVSEMTLLHWKKYTESFEKESKKLKQ